MEKSEKRLEQESTAIEMATWLAVENAKRNASRVCVPAMLTGKYLHTSDVVKIAAESGLGPIVLAGLLRGYGFIVPEGINAATGYSTRWPRWMRAAARKWINESIADGRYGDEWLSVDDCVVEFFKAVPEAEDYVTSRSMRMALDVEGFKTVRRANGRGIVGYCIKREL